MKAGSVKGALTSMPWAICVFSTFGIQAETPPRTPERSTQFSIPSEASGSGFGVEKGGAPITFGEDNSPFP